MLSSRLGFFYLDFAKAQPLRSRLSRKFSDQAVVKAKKLRTSIKLDKKPTIPPFMKNVFLGIYDAEMLTYPELDKSGFEELKKICQPYKDYFSSNFDSHTISKLKVIPNEIKENFNNLGLYGQLIPSFYGGIEQSAIETAFISEVIAKDLDVAVSVYSHNFLAAQSLVMFGTPEQKEKYLPLLASGEWIAAFGVTENDGGSDLASVKSTVVPNPDNHEKYLLNGSKQWVVNGSNANLFIILVKSTLTTYKKEKLPSYRLLVVERDSPGITVSNPIQQLGLNACGISDIYFENTPVETTSFIGGDDEAFQMCTTILNSGRYNIGAITASMLRNELHKVSDFIISRRQIEKPLMDFESIQNKVTEVAHIIYALESMTYHTAAILDKYETPDTLLEQAIIKVFSFTEGRRALDILMELMGGRAYLDSHTIQKSFRDFRCMEVFDGSTDITKLFISLVGLQHAGLKLNETISRLRFPFDYPLYTLNQHLKFRRQRLDDPKLVLELYQQLHQSLTLPANQLEYCVLRFHYAVTVLFSLYGNDIINQQIELMRIANAAVKIYAMTAVLGRSSRSYCIGLGNADAELKVAVQLCSKYKREVQMELNDVVEGVVLSGDALTVQFGPLIFKNHGYFMEHPLQRNY